MNSLAPEIRVLEVFARLVAKQPLYVLADKGRAIVSKGPEAVDDGRRPFHQREQMPGGCLTLLGSALPFKLLAFERRIPDGRLDDIDKGVGVVV